MSDQALATRDTGTNLGAMAQKNAFEQYAEATQQNKIVGDLLKFTKGNYFAGQDEDQISVGTQLVANMDEAMVGWVKWEDSKPTDMQMGRICDGHTPVRRSELGDDNKEHWETDDQGRPRDPWQLTNYLILKDPRGEQLYTFATSSKGGLNAVGRLCAAYGKGMRQKPDQFPVVALNVDSYKHRDKTYGRIFVPQLDIEGWAPKFSLDDVGGDDSKQDEAPAPVPPKAAGRKASAPTAQTQF